MANDQLIPIDVAGVDLGFAVLTDRHLTIGNVSKFLRKPKVWGSYPVEDLDAHTTNPKGIGFHVEAFGR